jgi:hypothetical protein
MFSLTGLVKSYLTPFNLHSIKVYPSLIGFTGSLNLSPALTK